MYGRYPPGNHRNPYPATPAYKVTGEAVRIFIRIRVLRFFRVSKVSPIIRAMVLLSNCISHISNNNTS